MELSAQQADMVAQIARMREKVIEGGNLGPFVLKLSVAQADVFAGINIQEHLGPDVRVEVVAPLPRPAAPRVPPGFRRISLTPPPTNGAREVARRLRQAARKAAKDAAKTSPQ